MKSIVIFGGAGFIGRNLCNFYIEKGYHIIVIDNFITGRIWEDNNITFINHDICNSFTNELLDFIKKSNVNYIYNLACIASPIIYKEYPLETLMVGSIGTKNIFDMCLLLGIESPILISSTSEIYGEPSISPQNEEYYGNVNTFGERSCYDESKRFMEALSYTYIKKGLDIKIARIFNTYGEYMDINDGRVIPNMIKQCINNEPITIYGSGEQTRSFCYISDTINGLDKLINSDINEPVNIGNPNTEYTIGELSIIINNIFGNLVDYVYLPLTQNDPLQRKPDITKAKELLKWEPKIGFEQGLLKTVKFFKKFSE